MKFILRINIQISMNMVFYINREYEKRETGQKQHAERTIVVSQGESERSRSDSVITGHTATCEREEGSSWYF